MDNSCMPRLALDRMRCQSRDPQPVVQYRQISMQHGAAIRNDPRAADGTESDGSMGFYRCVQVHRSSAIKKARIISRKLGIYKHHLTASYPRGLIAKRD